MDNFWTEEKLYYHHEFINDTEFDPLKKEKLKYNHGTYFINKDFTIYQEKEQPFDKITKHDIHNNYATFLRILYHLPLLKVEEFLEFHFNKFEDSKMDFLNFTYSNFKQSKLTQGQKVLPPPEQKLILLKWCEEKIEQIKPSKKKQKQLSNKEFVNNERIEQLRNISNSEFDLKRLIRMLDEINDNYSLSNFLSVAMLSRAIIDHIPPLFGLNTFNEVTNNYGNKSFKKNMEHLNNSMRSIADSYLHVTIRKNESLPNETQIDFSRELDFLLAEVIRIHSK